MKPIVRATASLSDGKAVVAHQMTASVPTAMTAPATTSQMSSGVGRIGSFAGRGLRCMSPSAGLPYPRPTAWKTSTVKLIHSVWSGKNGIPPAMLKIAEPRNVMMKPKSQPIWARMYFFRLS